MVDERNSKKEAGPATMSTNDSLDFERLMSEVRDVIRKESVATIRELISDSKKYSPNLTAKEYFRNFGFNDAEAEQLERKIAH